MAVTVLPISDEVLPAVGLFLSDHWPSGDKESALAEHWIRTVSPPWQQNTPNHEMRVDDGTLVGVYLAPNVDRLIDGRAALRDTAFEDEEITGEMFETQGSLADFVDAKVASLDRPLRQS